MARCRRGTSLVIEFPHVDCFCHCCTIGYQQFFLNVVFTIILPGNKLLCLHTAERFELSTEFEVIQKVIIAVQYGDTQSKRVGIFCLYFRVKLGLVFGDI